MPVNGKLLAAQSAVLLVALLATLFLPAGSLSWLAGWAYLVLFFGFFMGVNAWLARHNPGLLNERLRLSRPDQKGWDKILFPVLYLFPVLWLAFISLDAVRLHWSPVPAWGQVAGALVLLASFGLLFLTFRENTYLSTVIRIQQERGHKVISTGPYHYVRHPMYAGMLLFSLGTPLMLGSWLGLLIGVVFMAILARRTILEERTLRAELPGYLEYMDTVKYRLIPRVW